MSETAATVVDRRAAIVEAAVTVFAAHGFEAGTIRKIAREAGVAEGLIYHYFDSKEALLDAIIRDRSVLAWLEQPGALPRGLTAREALYELLSEALARLAMNADIVGIVWSQVPTNSKMARVLGRALRDMTRRVTRFLKQRVAKGELVECRAELVARTIAGALMAFTIQQEFLSPPLRYFPQDEFVDSLLDMTLNGLLADGEAEEEATRIEVE